MSFETTDIAAKVNPSTIDPIKTMEGLAGLQNTLNQNKMFQAKTLAGQYLTQSTGPDGTPDLGKFSQFLQGDSRTASYAPEILSAAQTLHGAGIQNQQGATNLAQSQQSNLRQDLAISGTSSPTGDMKENALAATKTLLDGVKTGRYSQEMADEAVGNLGSYIRSAVISGAGGSGAQEALTGTPSEVQTGGSLRAVTTNKYTGTQTPLSGSAAVIPDEQSPEYRSTRQGFIDPRTGQPFSVPNALLSTPTGEPTSVPGLTGPHGEIQTGQTPGDAEALATVKKNQVDQYTDLKNTYSGSKDRQTLINNLLTAAQNTRTGPNAAATASLVTEANRILGTHFDEKSSSSSQIVQALTNQIISNQDSIVGKSSNHSNLQVANLANPNSTISNEAVKELSAQMLGNEDAIQAQSKAADKWITKGGDPKKFQEFKNEWVQNVDPRIFQEKYMTPQQKQELYSDLKTSGKLDSYQSQKARVLKQGWMQ